MGNSTVSPKVWDQPDSTTMEYMTKGETIRVNVTFQQMGVDPSPVTADAKLECGTHWSHNPGVDVQHHLAAGQTVRVLSSGLRP